MLGLGDDPFKFAAFRVMFRIFFTVFRFTNLTDSFHRTGGCAAGAIVRFRVACISGADAGVRAVTVGRPCAEIVVERLAGFKGRFIGCALGAQTADGAGFVVDSLCRTGGVGFQIVSFRNLSGEIV